MVPPAHITITREMAEFMWNSIASARCLPMPPRRNSAN